MANKLKLVRVKPQTWSNILKMTVSMEKNELMGLCCHLSILPQTLQCFLLPSDYDAWKLGRLAE